MGNILLIIGSVGVFGILVVLLFNRLAGPFLRNMPIAMDQEIPVSILIPARNEADVIATCLQSVMKQSYRNLEILVLDDRSEDSTGDIVRELALEDPRIRLLEGKPLPDGWTGKNWACHQLSLAANGSIFIFTDADTWHHENAVSHTVGAMNKYQLDVLSAFSQQKMETVAEKLIIPSIDSLVYSFLPLWSTYLLPFSAFAAANGQWLAFSREAYMRLGGHAEVRNEIVEDVYLARRAKKMGLKTLTVAGTGQIFCRMYRSFQALWQGVRKSIMGIMGYNYLLISFAIIWLVISMLLPFFMLFFNKWFIPAVIGVSLNLIYRFLLAKWYRHPVLFSIVFHPLSVIMFIAAMIMAIFQYRKGYFIWKERTIPVRRSV
ncbi:MAG: hydroxychlorobactene glucosyltransferase CruC [Calditrichia bacterium]